MRIGVDLGGTKIEVLVLSDDGRELLRRRVATPKNDYRATLQCISDLVTAIEASVGEQGSVGVATPGALSPDTGRLKNSNSVCLNGQRFKEDLEGLLKRNVRTANDANCFALSEATDGAAQDAEIVLGVIVGTGTGAGIVVNGRLLVGANAIAGEWGHNPLPWPRRDECPGPPCYCGRHGCIETFLSGPGLSDDHRRATNQVLSAREIVNQARQGDRKCEASLKRYEDRMARGLAHVINIVDPDVIVLGGGLSNLARLYVNVPLLWHRYVFSDRIKNALVPPRHGDSSGVRGAAWLWDEQADDR